MGRDLLESGHVLLKFLLLSLEFCDVLLLQESNTVFKIPLAPEHTISTET